MISKSGNHNPNYLAKVVRLTNPVKHPNADRLQGWIIDGNRIWTDMSRKEGDLGIFFPIECKIHEKILHKLNMFSDANKNLDPTVKGYFSDKCRVKAVRLRGEPSMGVFLRVEEITLALDLDPKLSWHSHEGEEFDTIQQLKVVEKYIPKRPVRAGSLNQNNKPKKIRQSRIVEGQFHKHVDTNQLAKNMYHIKPSDKISLSNKLHGTSFVVGNILVKRKKTILERIASWLGAKIKDEVYDIIYSSRNVIQNEYENKKTTPYYKVNIYEVVAKFLEGKVEKGITLYGEAVGYLQSGGMIQKDYDYGYKPPTVITAFDARNIPVTTSIYREGENFGVYIYRITYTNKDGVVREYSSEQIQEYCTYYGLKPVPHFYEGLASNWPPAQHLDQDNHWQENYLELLQKTFLEGDCTMCTKKVPAEGIVLRRQTMFNFDAYKLKSFRFLEKESKELDKGEIDMETAQSELVEEPESTL